MTYDLVISEGSNPLFLNWKAKEETYGDIS